MIKRLDRHNSTSYFWVKPRKKSTKVTTREIERLTVINNNKTAVGNFTSKFL